MWRTFTSNTVKPPGSRMFITGFRYTPVLSIATWVTPGAGSHSFSPVKDLVVDRNVRGSDSISVPLTVAPISFLWTSRPHLLSTTSLKATSCFVRAIMDKVLVTVAKVTKIRESDSFSFPFGESRSCLFHMAKAPLYPTLFMPRHIEPEKRTLLLHMRERSITFKVLKIIVIPSVLMGKGNTLFPELQASEAEKSFFNRKKHLRQENGNLASFVP